MKDRAKGALGKLTLLVIVGALSGALFAASASANNLDRRTAQNAAKLAAKKECRQTSGCNGYAAKNVVLLTHHKAGGKVYVNSVKNGEQFQCRQQIVIHLDHFSGRIRYALSQRRCVDLGPAS